LIIHGPINHIKHRITRGVARNFKWWGGKMANAEREPIWEFGTEPQRGPEQSPWSGGFAPEAGDILYFN
jgi:hypothetical protein